MKFIHFAILVLLSTNLWANPKQLNHQYSVSSNSESIVTEVGKAKVIRLPKAATRIAVGDPNVIDFVRISNNEIYILGKMIGSTNIIYWKSDGSSSLIEAQVVIDIEALKQQIKFQLPDELDLKVTSSSGSLILGGTVSDTVSAATVLDITNGFIRNINRNLIPNRTQTSIAGGISGDNVTNSTPNRAIDLIQIVNLMKIRDPQQVMLEVKVAEIRKDLAEQLNIGVNAQRFSGGDVRWSIITEAAKTGIGTASLFSKGGGNGQLNINAEKKDTLVKILAEPTIVAMSGQEGSFLAGGKVLIPVNQGGVGTASSISLKELEYGVGLKFIPTVLDGGRINLKVAPEVSEISQNQEYVIANGNNLPSFTTRRVSTTVQLLEGQSLIIGGLMSNNLAENVSAFPILGEIPIIGALFRSSDFNNRKTELVIVVSPSLARATEIKPKLPTDNLSPPSRAEFFLEGKLEGKTNSANLGLQ